MSLSKVWNENERFRLVFTKMLVFVPKTGSLHTGTAFHSERRTPHPARRAPSVFCKLGRPHYLQAGASCESCNVRKSQYPSTRDAKSSCNQRLPQCLATMAVLIPFFHQGNPQYHAGRDALGIMKGVPTSGVPNILQPGGVPSTCKQGRPQSPFSLQHNLSVMQPGANSISCNQGRQQFLAQRGPSVSSNQRSLQCPATIRYNLATRGAPSVLQPGTPSLPATMGALSILQSAAPSISSN
jgi:hypothetical protein